MSSSRSPRKRKLEEKGEAASISPGKTSMDARSDAQEETRSFFLSEFDLSSHETFKTRSWTSFLDETEASEPVAGKDANGGQASAATGQCTMKEMEVVSDVKVVETITVAAPTEAMENRRQRKPTSPKKYTPKPRVTRSLALAEALSKRTTARLTTEKKENTNVRSKVAAETTKNAPYNPASRKRHISGDSIASSVSARRREQSKEQLDGRRVPVKQAKIEAVNTSMRKEQSARKGPQSTCLLPSPREDWQEPKVGWCTDEKAVERREKEIAKAKEKAIYQRYIAEVPKCSRKKGLHPRTPNKFLNFSRRSWDAQIRGWKRSLYSWAGEEPGSSVNTSFCPSECDEEEEGRENDVEERANDSKLGGKRLGRQTRAATALKDVSIVLSNPDAMASLLGHFDMDTRKDYGDNEEESTLKAPSNSKCSAGRGGGGPIDFSQMEK